jgi:steroid delta-isomerase-like uncharacterized protein
MSLETNKAIVRRYYDQVIGQGRADLVEEFLVENIELHGTGLPPGQEAVKQWVTQTAAAFPDRNLAVEDLIAEGDKVVILGTFSGTHLGEMEGIPATGKLVTQPSITIFRLANGKIVEGWYAADNLSMMQQLGVIPAPQAA